MFDSLLTDLRGQKRRCTVYRSGSPLEIEQWFASHGVPVESRSLPPDGPAPFIEIEADDEVVGVIGVEAVEGLIEPPIRRPGDGDGTSEGYRVLFDLLDATVLSGMNRRELLAVSREIEDRAFRVGDGVLRVSFQTLSTFASQTAVYRALGSETDLDVHVYGAGDWTPPALPGVTYHADATGRFEPYWAMAYDGGSDSTQACGLVAEEQSETYTGFWTNDPTTVEEIATTLETG